jgi:hypothetical protein
VWCGRHPRPFPPAQRIRDIPVGGPVEVVWRRAASETAAAFAVSWGLAQRALNSAALTLPDVDKLAPRMLGIDEHPLPVRAVLP